jgi:hypothetical protein
LSRRYVTEHNGSYKLRNGNGKYAEQDQMFSRHSTNLTTSIIWQVLNEFIKLVADLPNTRLGVIPRHVMYKDY